MSDSEARGTVTALGVQAEVRHKYGVVPPEPRPGEHLWIMVGMWRVADPEGGSMLLDSENLITVDGPGCYVCEQPWTPATAARRCLGDPSRR
jgi:hypothetical protein